MTTITTPTIHTIQNKIEKLDETETLTLNGITYHLEEATITSTVLGYEPHGFLIAQIMYSGKNWRQSDPSEKRTPDDLQRYITGILQTLNMNNWETLTGTKLHVLRTNPLGSINGIINYDQTKAYIINNY